MEAPTKKRIAVFLANWELISVLANTVTMFSDHGYAVDLFLSRNHLFVEPDSLRGQPGVQIYDLHPGFDAPGLEARKNTRNGFAHGWKGFLSSDAHLLGRTITRARSALRELRHAYWQMRGSAKGLLDGSLVPRALSLMDGKHYHCLVGIEKSGLLWAAQVAERIQVPYVYYSLELYNDDYVRLGLLNSFSFQHTRWAERKYHQKAAATIVQDVERARVLLESNGVPVDGASVAYLPVSLLGKPCQERSSFLHERLGIPRGRKIILYFGHIRERRYALEVARVAQEGPEDWVFVMHGPCTQDTIEKIEALNVKQRVILSLKTVPADQVQEVIASADIGLALYSSLTQNERLTAFSSEKMALYMQCGVPFIAFDYPGYQRLVNEEPCGAVIRDIAELPQAVSTIFGAYEKFRQGAYRAFSRYYDFAANFSSVSQTVGRLGNGVPEN